jgi:nucleoid DNA-binding protein
LNPKKHKNLLKDLHEDLGLDQDLVELAMDFYWSSVRKTIISVAYPKINIENLGIFEVKLKTLQKTIFKYENSLQKLANANFAEYPRYENMKKRLDILENTREVILTERQRKKQIKTDRYDNTTRSLEEEGKDS